MVQARNRNPRSGWIVVAALLLAGVAHATTLVRLSFPELARRAGRVVVGTVTALDPHWDDSHRFIHTNVAIAVDRYVRGSGPSEIVLRTPGGRLDGRAMVAEGAPSFTPGEKVLVFLTVWDDGVAKVVGYSQGKSAVAVGVDGEVRLRGGVADGRSLGSVIDELRGQQGAVLPLRPLASGSTSR